MQVFPQEQDWTQMLRPSLFPRLIPCEGEGEKSWKKNAAKHPEAKKRGREEETASGGQPIIRVSAGFAAKNQRVLWIERFSRTELCCQWKKAWDNGRCLCFSVLPVALQSPAPVFCLPVRCDCRSWQSARPSGQSGIYENSSPVVCRLRLVPKPGRTHGHLPL